MSLLNRQFNPSAAVIAMSSWCRVLVLLLVFRNVFCQTGKGKLPESGPDPRCPDGSHPVTCEVNRCIDAVCLGEPSAECRLSKCGGCYPQFYLNGRRVSDSKCIGLGSCPDGTPVFSELSSGPDRICQRQLCQRIPNALCITDGCGGRNVFFLARGKILTKEDCTGCLPRECEPCERARCPDYPDARCEPRRCGTCRAVFYGADRQEINNCCKTETCRDGSNRFHCKKNPCDDAYCLAFPTATCKPDYCGGCKASFSLEDGTQVSEADCIQIEPCPRDVPTSKCSGNMCKRANCPNYPGAICKIDGCGGCKTIFFYKGKRITEEDCNGCPNGDRVQWCNDPCAGALCFRYPKARCEAQVCGTCKARFFGPDRQEIFNCGKSRGCGEGEIRFSCTADPCDIHICPGVRDAECRSNLCRGCIAEFYYRGTNMRIPEHDCAEKEPCPSDFYRRVCITKKPCLGETCPNFPDAKCYIDTCNGCHVAFYSGRRRLTREDCHGCPRGKEKMACGDPCENALCPLYPDARCESRVCGQCSAIFYGLDREKIDDCCAIRKNELPARNCFVPRGHIRCNLDCESSRCPGVPKAICRVDYCNCKREFYLDGRRLSRDECITVHPDGVCPEGKRPVDCGINSPCASAKCPAHPQAKCRWTSCGGCNYWFEDRNGRIVKCHKRVKCEVLSKIHHGAITPRRTVDVGKFVTYECDIGFRMLGNATRKCVDIEGNGRLSGSAPKCYSNLCPTTNDRSVCTPDCESDDDCEYGYACCWNGCASVCWELPPCGLGRCFGLFCRFASCPRYPEAWCRPNRCGCEPEWVVNGITLLPNDCNKPADPRCLPLNRAEPICSDECRSDIDCNVNAVCCFNGCGHTCKGL